MKWWKICYAVNTFGKITDHEFIVKAHDIAEALNEANKELAHYELDARIWDIGIIDEDVF